MKSINQCDGSTGDSSREGARAASVTAVQVTAAGKGAAGSFPGRQGVSVHSRVLRHPLPASVSYRACVWDRGLQTAFSDLSRLSVSGLLSPLVLCSVHLPSSVSLSPLGSLSCDRPHSCLTGVLDRRFCAAGPWGVSLSAPSLVCAQKCSPSHASDLSLWSLGLTCFCPICHVRGRLHSLSGPSGVHF